MVYALKYIGLVSQTLDRWQDTSTFNMFFSASITH